MPVRTKQGRRYIVSAPQTAAEGRTGATDAALTVRRRPLLLGEEGAVAALALAHVQAAIAVQSGTEVERSTTGRRVRYERARLRALIGKDETKIIEAALTVSARLPLQELGELPMQTRQWLVQGAIAAAATAREYNVVSGSALASIATGERMRAVGRVLLQEGTRTLDREVLKLAASMLSAGRLEILNALQLSKQSNEVAEKAAQAKRFAGWGQRPATPAAEHED